MPLQTLLEQYNKIYNYFIFVTANKELSEDLTQETFYQALLSIHRFQGKSKLSTWLYGIARNIYLKSRAGEKSSLFESHFNDIKAPEKYQPEEVLEKKEISEKITGTLQKLPKDYKTVLVLREIESFTFEEIAEVMNKSPNAARVTLFRAKKAFRRIYDRQG